VTYSTNKTPGQWKAHGHYIARDSATQKGDTKAVGFSATESAVNVAERLAYWQAEGDERMFKIIVSPEFGERIDLEKHTRDLMKQVERSLQTRLEWVAVIHHNTEHPHVHIALRGIDERGAALRLPRSFVQFGIRQLAEDLATKQIGYRTERDALEAQRREVSQLRFTSLDRVIGRNRVPESDYFTVRKSAAAPRTRFGRAREHYLNARLAQLEKIGLAARTGGNAWVVRGDFEEILRTMQQTNDRQKVLARHAALVSDERLPFQVTPFSAISLLEGRVLGHGQEEGSDRPYLLLEGVEGKVHFISQNADIQAARRDGQLRVNAFVRMEKQFVANRPSLKIEDYGDSRELLQNDRFFREAALRLHRTGVLDIEPRWGGWLGEYERCLHSHLIIVQDRQRHVLKQLGLER
jgi:type IV secretory pathway VirD2 relaxase